jgi:hypothetical protein
MGSKVMFMMPPPTLLVLYGESLMKYTGRHENDFTTHG